MTIRLVSELPKTKPSRGEEEAQAQAMNEPNEGLTLKENVNKHLISSRITKKIENSLEEIQTAKDKIKLDRETKHKRILGYIQSLFSTEAELEKANKAIAKAVEVLVADRVFYQNYFGKSNWDSLPRQDKALFYLLQYGDNLLNLGEPKGVPIDK